MPPIDLANIKTRLIGCGAIQLVGQTISAALSVSTASTLGGAAPLVLVGSVLAAIASDLASGMMATELGNHITDRFSKNPKILNNHDLTLAAGEAVATRQQVCDLINKLDAIALDLRDDLAQVKASLQRLVDTSATRLPLPYECETIIQD